MKDSLKNRIIRHSKSLYQDYKRDLTFSSELAYSRFIASVADILHLHKVSRKYWSKKHQAVEKILMEQLGDLLSEPIDAGGEGGYTKNAPIWVCWWQGLDSAPELVKLCVNSVQRNANGHPVNLITKETVSQYIEIPAFILDKAESGKIGLANLADYIRVSLIAQYGGIWIDATVFVSKPIPEWVFECEFYSCKDSRQSEHQGVTVTSGKWVTYAIGGWRQNALFCFLKRAFESFWKNNIFNIDYFFIDYLIHMSFAKSNHFQELYETLPANNELRYALRDAMLRDEPAENLDQYLQTDTFFHKLSYKSPYGLTTADGKKSIFAEFLDRF